MRIEQLKTSPDRAGRYAVRFENGEVLRLYRQTVEDFGLYTGMELSGQEFAALQEAAGQMSAKMRAVRIVSATSVSKKDLEQRLIHKGEDPRQAKEAVRWMSDLNLLDDARMAHQVVERCIAKGYGPQRARQALYEKRVPKEFWEDALADYPDMEDAVVDFLRSRLGPDSGDKEVRRCIDALLRRGHSYGLVRRALDKLDFDSDEFPEE